MDVEAEIRHLLREHGAILARNRKHRVWKFPDGRIWVEASTPSDQRVAYNQLADLRNLLGVKRITNKNPARKRKPGVERRVLFSPVPSRPDWKEKLRSVRLFRPVPCCYPIERRPVPMTPLWCMLRNLFGYGGER